MRALTLPVLAAALALVFACDHTGNTSGLPSSTAAPSGALLPPPAGPSSASERSSSDAAAPRDAGALVADASPAAAEASTGTPAAPPPEGMLLVPGGTYTMGADTGGEEDEHPAHAVTVRSFWLDKTEVTNAAYAECVAAKACRPKSQNEPGFDGPEQPVDFVAWDDAKAYCAWKGKRLPREAEFERAVRDDDGRNYPWGNDPPTKDIAVFSQATTQPVGSRGKKGEGRYGHDDLAGNIWEWQEDLYDPYAYRRPTAAEGKPGTCEEIMATLNQLRRDGKQGFTGSNPIPDECEHSIRGGAYNYGAPGLRASNRVHHPGRYRIRMLGFRCAKDAE